MIALRVYCCRMLVLPFERWFWFIASGDISWKSPSNSNTFKVVRVFSHVPLKIDLQSIYSTFSYCVTTNWCHQNRNYILFKFGKFAKLNSKWLHFRCGLFQSKSPTYLLSFLVCANWMMIRPCDNRHYFRHWNVVRPALKEYLFYSNSPSLSRTITVCV